MRRILLLRTFRGDAVAAADVRLFMAAVEGWGQLVLVGDPSENEKLRALVQPARVGERDALKLVGSSDLDWRSCIIDEILRADAIVFRLTPKSSFFPSFQAESKPFRSFANFYDIALVDPRTGRGLLAELAYCGRLNALPKSLLAVDEAQVPLIEEFVTVAEFSRADIFAFRAEGLAPMMPRLTVLDKQLSLLKQTAFAVVVPQHPGFFRWRIKRTIHTLREALMKLISIPAERSDIASRRATGYLDVGISDSAMRVFPDYELKRIRFTPVEQLLATPRGVIVEISRREASEIFGLHHSASCPHCGAVEPALFLYTRGLAVDYHQALSCKCQHCGRSSTELDGALMEG